MNKWNLIIDVAGCENCNNCVLAAKDELVGNHFPGYSEPHAAQGAGVIRIERTVRGSAPMVDVAYLPVLCNHCDAAPCMAADTSNAIYKRDDGIVMIDPIKAKGRRDLVEACPYGAIVWNEAQQLPQNWFFDAHLLDTGWQAPRMVSVCPTNAIKAVKISDAAMTQRAEQQGLQTLRPELRSKPRVFYKNLHRINACFIGGSASALIDGRTECIADAEVVIKHMHVEVARTRTDAFGDFKFDALSQRGRYEISVMHQSYGAAQVQAELGSASIYLGEIMLRHDSGV